MTDDTFGHGVHTILLTPKVFSMGVTSIFILLASTACHFSSQDKLLRRLQFPLCTWGTGKYMQAKHLCQREDPYTPNKYAVCAQILSDTRGRHSSVKMI